MCNSSNISNHMRYTNDYLRGLTDSALISYEECNGRINEDKGLLIDINNQVITFTYIVNLSSNWNKDHELANQTLIVSDLDEPKAVYNDINNILTEIDSIKL